MALSSMQYDEIMREYDQIRLDNIYLVEQRRQEFESTYPEYTELTKRIAEISMKRAYSLLGSDESEEYSREQYEKELNKLEKKKIKILTDNGFDKDYLQMIYTCPVCRDEGFVNGVPCACFEKKIIEHQFDKTNDKNLNEEETFERFNFDYYSKDKIDERKKISAFENIHKVYDASKQFADEFSNETGDRNMLYLGPAGLGKTYLTNCVTNVVKKKGYSVIYLTAIELFEQFAAVMENRALEKAVSNITECDLLIIDDLGTELSNSFTCSKLFYVINDRLLNKKSTIISTNLELDKILDMYSDRIFSRIIQNYKVCRFFGDNIRVTKKLNEPSMW